MTDEKIEGMAVNKLIGDVTATAYSGPVAVTQVQSGILADTVIASSIAVDAVKTAQIENLAVTAEKLADMAIPYAKINRANAIRSTDLSSPVFMYETNDGRLIIGNSYLSSMCLLSGGNATYYDCIYDDKGTLEEDERMCDQPTPKACTAPSIVGYLVN